MNRLLSLLFLAVVATAPAAAQEVTGLSGWNLFLDPGHGGSNQNTGVFGYSEANKVLAIGLELRDLLLSTTDIDTVYMSRTRDIDVSLSQRVDMANSVGAAHFHSIHSNAAGPSANHVFVLWPQYPDGREAVPNGGKRMAEIMSELFGRSMRIPSRGGFGECDFYGASNCRSSTTAPKGSRNYVQGYTVMPSQLSEAGFHTNPTQNQRNMNADWKRMEARAMYWSILEYHDLDRPNVHIAAGIVTDLETGEPVNGARVTVGDRSYTTDTYESLFHRYSNDPDELHNGFYYLEDLPDGTLPVTVEAEGFETYTGEVALIDTFFTFHDATLVSTVPPTVAESSPRHGDDLHRIVDPIVLTFSRRMDPGTVEAAFTIAPEVNVTYHWSNANTRLVVVPDSLSPQTTYHVSVGASAVGAFGHAFDGNGDGTPGGAYALTFTTGFRDTTPPRILTSYPRVNARFVELRPVITVEYSEVIEPSSFVARLEQGDGTGRIDGQLAHRVVGGRSTLTFFPSADLAPATTYRLFIEGGVSDPFGNADALSKQVRFTTGETALVATPIDAFEGSVLANWWVPQQSGSTTGIVTDSTNARLDGSVANLLTGSTASLRLDYGWDDQAGAWLIREYLGGGPPRDVRFDTTYTLQAYVFGDGSGTLFRFAVDDNVQTSGGHEVSPWYPIDWLGWRPVSWNMGKGETGTWIGDGVVEGTLRFDSIQLSYAPGGARFGTLFVDDLRLVRATPTTAVDPDAGLPAAFRLYPNYPNPFNPRTTLRFDLAAPSEVHARIYNALGAQVATLSDGRTYAAGTHALTWDADGLPSGVYFARVEAAGHAETVRLVLLK